MKAYLITMFIFWIIKVTVMYFGTENSDIPDGLKYFGKLIAFAISIGMAVWTGMLLF